MGRDGKGLGGKAKPGRRHKAAVSRRPDSRSAGGRSAKGQDARATRLARELKEALEQQSASSDVLKVINRSPGNLAAVFDAIVDKALQLCEAKFGGLWIVDGELARPAATRNVPKPYNDFLARQTFSLAEAFGREIGKKPFNHVADVAKTESYRRRLPLAVASVELGGARTYLAVPMRDGDALAGVLSIYRKEVRPFSARQIALLRGFAVQAEIAMKNARLFDETREAMERQTATADILKVIASSPSDVQPVFDAIATRANSLIGGFSSTVFHFIDGMAHLRALTPTTPEADEILKSAFPRRVADFAPFQMAQAGKVTQIPDTEVLADEIKNIARARGYRSMLFAPLMNKDVSIGFIAVTRIQPGNFADHHVQLLRTFADQAVIAIENARLFDEVQARTRDLEESLQQQTATADVLKVISRSAFELEPVFNTIIQTASRLCEAEFALIFEWHGDRFEIVAANNAAEAFVKHAADNPIPLGRGSLVGRTALARKPIHIPDCLADTEYSAMDYQSAGQYRTMLGVPLLREGAPIGVIGMMRATVRPFTERQIDLVTTFADQAVIAIENARLFDEVQAKSQDLSEALSQQTATADVLKVITRSTFNLQTVLDTLVESATRLCDAQDALIFLPSNDVYRVAARYGFTPEYHEYIGTNPIEIDRGSVVGRTVLDKRLVHISDVLADPNYTRFDAQKIAGYRAVLGAPMLREGKVVGVIFLTRTRPEPFTEKQIELVKTFADQAIIAVENTRLFDEVQAKTRDLEQSLQQQTATADVLKVISRSAFDLHTVLDTLTESAARLCSADMGAMTRQAEDGGFYHVTNYNFSVNWLKISDSIRLDPGRGSLVGRVLLSRKAVQIADVLADPEYAYADVQRAAGYRTLLGVPMLRSGQPIGVLFLARKIVEPFSDKQVELVSTFADQAVIAIENARLFDEVQAKTQDLEESLQQQTATAEVLKTISRSTFDLPAVLHALVETAAQLCDADKGTITREKDGAFYRAESCGFSEEFMNLVRDVPVVVDRHTATGRALLEGIIVHIPDVERDPDYRFGEGRRLGDYRALLGVPMLREGVPIGVITLTRTERRAFTEKQIELAMTFADQAAIAIQNVRLFAELQTRTQELSRSLEELRAAQDRLVQTEKLASLGQLTAGIAHEIKNPLNFVNNFAALSVELVDEMDDALDGARLQDNKREEFDEIRSLLKGNLEKVVQHGNRADSIVKNMLLHSRSGSGERQPVEINAIMDESLNLAYHGARAEKQGFNITLERDFDAEAGIAEIYPQEITRVFLNLISNGFYAATKRASEAGNGFEPKLKAMTRDLGDKVEIRIRDNGAGIPPEIREKIFNPFFTTKPAGEGTGLGLSISHDIVVKQHGGMLLVASEPGTFTEFIITLPRNPAQAMAGEQKN